MYGYVGSAVGSDGKGVITGQFGSNSSLFSRVLAHKLCLGFIFCPFTLPILVSSIKGKEPRNMSRKASSSHSNSGFSGSGALSHVYIEYPHLRCNIRGARGLFYDDGNKLLVSPTSDQVFSWKTSPFSPLVAPTSDSVCEGPVLSVRFSLDAKVLAIQRSNHDIQFWNRETGNTFSQKYRSDSESILGFFWTDCPTCDIVFVKTSGLDLFSLDSELKSLLLVETKRFNVSWYVYTHESRLLLLASGMQCKSFIGYQLSAAGIIRLPKFEMAMAKSEANSKPVLAAEDVHIVTIYGRIYCLQVDRVAMLLHSHRFYRDAVVQQGSLPIYSSKIAVSVVDNVLLVHEVDAKVVILYDIFSDSQAPISAPLPLLLRSYPRAISASSQSNTRDAETSEAKDLSDIEAVIYGDGWTFLVPDLICDAANGLLWKIHLDLEASTFWHPFRVQYLILNVNFFPLQAISTSSSEVTSVLEFLQRRKLEAYKAKQLCLAIARTNILERRPVSMVARAIDILVTSYSYSLKTGSHFKGMKAEKNSTSGVPQVDSPSPVTVDSASRVDSHGKSVHESTSGVHNESISRSSTFSGSDSENNEIIKPQKTTPVDRHSVGGKGESEMQMGPESHSKRFHQSPLQSQLLGPGNNQSNANVTNHQESQVISAAISPDEMYSNVFAPVEEEIGDSSYLILEPSKEVALQLLESGRQNIQTRKLGLDMLRQLSLHHDYVLLLVQDGYYLEALRYVRKNKVNSVRPSLFLEAAYASNDSQQLAAVLRFFSDFIPEFKSTSDHNSYSRVLAEMNSSVAA
ncbi:hypothetical protein RHGRI_006214 [Rhododendron griersonianum]|uniref:Mic1 domain-containing protein n=1 Tax=Rhododendron griersonianum TaxID=479676 RepID=A0AAV6KS99_9ERIC|nr:hypothetical protein RHGRI_006214 [Rhododendron griersonianum]